MRCPNCGANGYSRKTKTPEWRCSEADYNGGCGHEWDTNSPDESSTKVRPDPPRFEPQHCPYCRTSRYQWCSLITTTTSYDYQCMECLNRWDTGLDVADIEASVTPLQRKNYRRRFGNPLTTCDHHRWRPRRVDEHCDICGIGTAFERIDGGRAWTIIIPPSYSHLIGYLECG